MPGIPSSSPPAPGQVPTFFNRSRALTEKDSVVLADFVNTTGDPVFRRHAAPGAGHPTGTIAVSENHGRRAGAARSSPDESSARRAHHQSDRARNLRARRSRGHHRRRDREPGKSYVITLQAITCQDGATLAREQIQAEDKEHVLNAVGTAATAMRAKLGESLNSIQKLNRPLEAGHHSFARSSSELHRGLVTRWARAISWPLFRCLSAPPRSIRISPWLTTLLGVAFGQCRGHRARRRILERLLR